MLDVHREGAIVIWIILAIAAAGVAAISFSVVHPLVGIGLVLATVVAAVAISDRRDRARRASAGDVSRSLDEGTDHAQRAERRWNLPTDGGIGGAGGGSSTGG